MADTDETPTAISRLAIGALIAGIVAVILLATQPFDGQGWTGAVGVTGISLAVVDIIESRRAHRTINYMAVFGAILALAAIVLAFVVWPELR